MLLGSGKIKVGQQLENAVPVVLDKFQAIRHTALGQADLRRHRLETGFFTGRHPYPERNNFRTGFFEIAVCHHLCHLLARGIHSGANQLAELRSRG